MKLFIITFFSVLLLVLCTTAFKFSEYETRNIEGWTVKIAQQLLTDDRQLADRAIDSLNTKLENVKRVIPAKHHQFLQSVPIWLEKSTPGFKGMVYHPSAKWLANNGYNPDKAKAIEITNAKNFIDWTATQPWHVLHELSHAYHDRIIGNSYRPIAKAYDNAVSSSLYQQVSRNRGSKLWEAYAIKNQREYFAELTEAYFGENDFYPFNRQELKEYDPQGYAAIEEAWQIDLAMDN